MSVSRDLREERLLILDQRAARGDEVSRWAAECIRRSSRSGRPKIDDDVAIFQIEDLIQSDKTLSVWAAAKTVALTLSNQQSAESATARLFQKVTAKKKLSLDASN